MRAGPGYAASCHGRLLTMMHPCIYVYMFGFLTGKPCCVANKIVFKLNFNVSNCHGKPSLVICTKSQAFNGPRYRANIICGLL